MGSYDSVYWPLRSSDECIDKNLYIYDDEKENIQ